MDAAQHEEVTHQDDEVSGRFVLRLLAALASISVTLCVIAYLLLVARESQLRPGRRFPEKALGVPREVANVRVAPFELPQPVPPLAEQQRRSLDRYGWVDQKAGIVRVPVDRAVELLLRGAALPGGRP